MLQPSQTSTLSRIFVELIKCYILNLSVLGQEHDRHLTREKVQRFDIKWLVGSLSTFDDNRVCVSLTVAGGGGGHATPIPKQEAHRWVQVGNDSRSVVWIVMAAPLWWLSFAAQSCCWHFSSQELTALQLHERPAPLTMPCSRVIMVSIQVAPVQVVFHGVFVPQLGTTLSSFSSPHNSCLGILVSPMPMMYPTQQN